MTRRMAGAALHVLAGYVLACVVGCSTQLEAPDSTFAEPKAPVAAPAKRCEDCAVRFERYLAAPRPLPRVRFGHTIALSGTRVAIAAPFENAAGTPDDPEGAPNTYVPLGEGVTYVFDLEAPEREPIRVVTPNADPGDGQVPPTKVHQQAWLTNQPLLSLAANDDFLIIGASGEDSALVPSDAVSVATAEANNAAEDAGAVYVYAWSDLEQGRIEPVQYIKAPNAGASDLFGAGLALSKTRLIVGAPGEDSASADEPMTNDVLDCGAVYSYELENGRFVFRQMLKAPAPQPGDFLGRSVAIEGDVLVAGAPGQTVGTALASGAAYVYRLEDNHWVAAASLQPDISIANGTFGLVVRISEQRIAVANPGAEQCMNETVSAKHRGAVYVFWNDAGSWKTEACIGPGRQAAGDLFGSFVGLSGDWLAVGAPWDDSSQMESPEDHGMAYAGAAYLEARDAARWNSRAYVKAPRPAEDDVFGASIDIGPQWMVISAEQRSLDERGHEAPVYSGAVYAFTVNASAPSP